MFRWVDHTSEVELHIEAPSERQVFADALDALRDLLGGPGTGDQTSREVEVEAPDRAALLAGWIEELVVLAEGERLVPDSVERLELSERWLRAAVRGRGGDPAHIVKAVTYHRLSFEPSHDGWRATMVLDV